MLLILAAIAAPDLEERVAELEATTARKGNRKVSLTISGHVNQAILIWDDGDESDVYVVGNSNDDLSMFRFEGEAKINSRWTAGYLVEIEVGHDPSSDVSQESDDADEQAFGISDVSMYIEGEGFGRITWGFTGQPSDGAPEVDLSGAGYAGYAAIADVAGGFGFRTTAGMVSPITIGDVFDDLNGDSFNIIRYDTPTFAGFTLSASWGEDDIWDVAVNFEKELGEFEVAAAIAYTENRDNDDDGNPLDHDTIAGSFSVLHAPTGLNLTVAAGEREFNDGSAPDASFIYVKAGIFQKWNSLGKTAFYGEYGQFDDFFSTDAPGGLCGGGCAAITGSEADVWGVGVVQYIDAAAMQLYLAYRHHELDIEADAGTVVSFEDFDTVLAGARIEF